MNLLKDHVAKSCGKPFLDTPEYTEMLKKQRKLSRWARKAYCGWHNDYPINSYASSL